MLHVLKKWAQILKLKIKDYYQETCADLVVKESKLNGVKFRKDHPKHH